MIQFFAFYTVVTSMVGSPLFATAPPKPGTAPLEPVVYIKPSDEPEPPVELLDGPRTSASPGIVSGLK